MNRPSLKLLIRADGSARMGTGHVMRCLSLAQGWRRAGGEAGFVLAEATPALEQRLQDEGINITRLDAPAGSAADAAETARLARGRGAEWVVADGYHFDAAFQQAIKAAGLQLLVVDDFGRAGPYCADYILNQNFHAMAELYTRRAPHTRLLLGTRYALLRQQFDDWRGWNREFPAVARKVLVTLGGSDPDNVTGQVVEALAQISGLEVKVLIGGSNPHREQLQSKIQNAKSKISFAVDAPNMPELMAWADTAIVAGGTTCWELAFMGLPSLLLLVADNQRDVVQSLCATGVARETTPARVATDLSLLQRDTDGRRAMSQRARRLVDGQGTSRVVDCLRSAARPPAGPNPPG